MVLRFMVLGAFFSFSFFLNSFVVGGGGMDTSISSHLCLQ